MKDLWIDEGMAIYAEYLMYGKENQWQVDYFSKHPDTKLKWKKYIENNYDLIAAQYGAAYLFFYYIHEQLGKSTVLSIFKDSSNGSEGVESHLAGRQYKDLFID